MPAAPGWRGPTEAPNALLQQGSMLMPAHVRVSTHVDVQTQRGHGGSFAKRQHHEEQTSQQLHHVEEVVVGEQVGCQCLGIPRMGEELIIVLSLLFVDT